MKKSFVFIFRQGPTRLSDEDQKQRTEEVRDWALEQIKQGRNLEPRVLGDESYRLEEDAHNQSDDGTVVALNFIEATDINEAVSIARHIPACVMASGSKCDPGWIHAARNRDSSISFAAPWACVLRSKGDYESSSFFADRRTVVCSATHRYGYCRSTKQ